MHRKKNIYIITLNFCDLILKSGTNQPIAVYGCVKSKCVNTSKYMYLAQKSQTRHILRQNLQDMEQTKNNKRK
jgi:hypothetical protein